MTGRVLYVRLSAVTAASRGRRPPTRPLLRPPAMLLQGRPGLPWRATSSAHRSSEAPLRQGGVEVVAWHGGAGMHR